MAVRDAKHLRDLVSDADSTRPRVARIRNSLILEAAKGRVRSNFPEGRSRKPSG